MLSISIVKQIKTDWFSFFKNPSSDNEQENPTLLSCEQKKRKKKELWCELLTSNMK